MGEHRTQYSGSLSLLENSPADAVSRSNSIQESTAAALNNRVILYFATIGKRSQPLAHCETEKIASCQSLPSDALLIVESFCHVLQQSEEDFKRNEMK
jgi:hypothetical protein